jgi:A/G-specific adenine glycosylase
LRRRRREAWLLFAENGRGGVRLVRRAPAGVWGGLWSAPEFESRDSALAALPGGSCAREGAPLLHAFTPFDLLIRPLWVRAGAPADCIAGAADSLWYDAARPAAVGLPAPVVQLLQNPPP